MRFPARDRPQSFQCAFFSSGKMPSIRVTIASNVNRNKKAPLLVPIPDPAANKGATSISARYGHCFSFVCQEARKKLRLKHGSQIYIPGGRKICSDQDWADVLEIDMVLLIAGHEDYVGAKSEGSADLPQDDGQAVDTNPDCPVELLADQAGIDSTSRTQLENTARTLPGIVQAVGQPDLHPGTKFPIGAVFVSKGWIHPPLIGGDIGCGMAWYRTTLSRSQVEGDKGRKIAEKLRGLEGPWRTQEERELWLEQDRGPDAKFHNTGSSFSAGEEFDKSLGTIGAGNHFAELQIVEESSIRGDNPRCLREDDVVLLVHSGSRGYGGDILKRTAGYGRTSIRKDTEEARNYLLEHDTACEWASRNRDLIALRFLSILEPGMPTWDQAMDETDTHLNAVNLRKARSEIQARKVVDIHHNNITTEHWPPQRENMNGDYHFIHRKGAAPTTVPNTKEPLHILPLPGSRATPTLILHPTATEANDFGRINAHSLAHGAGRALSRAKAATYVSDKYAGRADDLLRGDFVRSDKQGNKRIEDRSGRNVMGGTWVVCEDKQLVWEEAGEAYKDVWDVGEDLVQKGCAERWGWCRPVVSYKVRKE